MNLEKFNGVYFIGIGEIGMSALARYFHALGKKVGGYDKTPSPLTDLLQAEGMEINFDANRTSIPAWASENDDEVLFVYTPAIPSGMDQLVFLQEQGTPLFKRSEVLGFISRNSFCIAVAGTHGKTTTSTLIAHLLTEAGINFTAFLGGIAANYDTNYLHQQNGTDPFPDKPVVVLEADEFDRSFHRLNPDMAVITAIDPDHLDIYGTEEAFRHAFDQFASLIKPGGILFYKPNLSIRIPSHIQSFSYAAHDTAGMYGVRNLHIENEWFTFNFTGHENRANLPGLRNGLPGFHNAENAAAALAVCVNLPGVDPDKLKKALSTFKGVKRRFEYLVRDKEHVVIDDYAHHPEELNAIIASVRALYPDRKLSGIFQPHLFTRTRDFAADFAASLSKLDALMLMEIYPAREEPIPGINSAWLLDKVTLQEKSLGTPSQILDNIAREKPSLLLILGAGDIDRLSEPIRNIYQQQSHEN